MNRAFLGRTMIAATALTAMGLVAAAPASAHTNNLFTVVIDAEEGAGLGFASMNKADGIATVLPDSIDLDVKQFGIEVVGEKGYVVGDQDGFFVAEWNHVTGEQGVPMSVYLADETEILRLIGLDTLNNGTLVTVIEVPAEGESTAWWVASVNAGTGLVTPLVDITDVIVTDDADFTPQSLATDPATGLTYVFLNTQNPFTYFVSVDVAGNTFGAATQFEGAGFEAGFMEGADFDPADGSLYFIYFEFVEIGGREELSRLGAPSTWATAERQEISPAPANFDTYRLNGSALTVEHTALAATGSELPLAAIVLVGSVAVLAGGITVMAARRRADRGTV